MDSVTQFVLGAGIGAAVLGRRIGVRKAAITGGLLATLPDMDVLWPYENDVARFTQHRSATHSLILHTLATPLIGEVVLRLRDLRGRRRPRATGRGGERRPWSSRGLAYLTVFLCLTTHALLDSLTIYGTQLFWPVWNEPLALGSIFIIDPAYTLPLLMITLWAIFQRNWTKWFGRALTFALLFSTAYLVWSAVAQQVTLSRADKLLAAHGVTPTQRISTPTAFNTLFWRIIAMDGSRYFSIYVPLLADEEAITAYVHQTSPANATGTNAATAATNASHGCVGNNQQAKTLATFTHGYYQIRRVGDDFILSDLRMGIPPNYVFQFVIATAANGALKQARRLATERSADGDQSWLWAGINGVSTIRPAEHAATYDLIGPAGPEGHAGCPEFG